MKKVVWFLQDGDTYTRRIGGKDQQGIRKNQSFPELINRLFEDIFCPKDMTS